MSKLRLLVPAFLLIAACQFQAKTWTSSSTGTGSGFGEEEGVPVFPVEPRGSGFHLVSQWGEPVGQEVEARCAWRRIFIYKTHIGGGKYGSVEVNFSGRPPKGAGMFTHRKDPRGLCSVLEAETPSDKELLELVQSRSHCGAECKRGARRLESGWALARSATGEPLYQSQIIDVLEVERPAGVVPDPGMPSADVLLGDGLRKHLASACQFPPNKAPCQVESAAIDDRVRFRQYEDSVAFDVFADVQVTVGSQSGTCRMRVSGSRREDKPFEYSSYACHIDTPDSGNDEGWDPRCYTQACIENFEKMKGQSVSKL